MAWRRWIGGLIALAVWDASAPAWTQAPARLAVETDDDEGDNDDSKDSETQAPSRDMHLYSARPTERVSFELLGGVVPEQALLFSGFDIWRYGFAAYGGVQWTPDRFLTSVMFLRMTTSETVARFSDGKGGSFTTQIWRGAALPGLRFQRGSVELQFYAGLDSEFDVIRPDNLYANKQGLRFGVRAGIDAWWQPTNLTMLAASISGSTIGPSYAGRIATGIRLFDRFWIGPEIAASGDQFSDQVRFGAHLTGLKIAGYEWSLATGYVRDSYNRDGVYGRIGIFMRQ